MALSGSFLCAVKFEVNGGIIPIGASPFGDSRVGYITGGHFEGPQLSGVVLPGGGNWSRAGRLGDDAALGTLDARALWRTHDGALIQLAYSGRSVVPDPVRAAFADPSAPPVDPGRYYLRISITFETASADYAWLNGILAVGIGERLPGGVRHQLYQVN